MDRAVSIHIGINQPRVESPGEPLEHSETTAWRMAALAHRAGYRSQRVLLGEEATRQAVHEALSGAAGTLDHGDILFVSFSGHGTRKAVIVREGDSREPDGWDEAWCLSDGLMMDNKLAGYWRLFEPGVRILVVTESCFGGGIGRFGDELIIDELIIDELIIDELTGDEPPGYESIGDELPAPYGEVEEWDSSAGFDGAAGYRDGETAAELAAPCIEAPKDTYGIRASLLLLSACAEDQEAQDGLFSRHLFEIWNEGGFDGTFYELHRQVHDQVVAGVCNQEPRLLMYGTPDPEFPRETAFHLDHGMLGRYPG